LVDRGNKGIFCATHPACVFVDATRAASCDGVQAAVAAGVRGPRRRKKS
jgi:hypothetical protein